MEQLALDESKIESLLHALEAGVIRQTVEAGGRGKSLKAHLTDLVGHRGDGW